MIRSIGVKDCVCMCMAPVSVESDLLTLCLGDSPFTKLGFDIGAKHWSWSQEAALFPRPDSGQDIMIGAKKDQTAVSNLGFHAPALRASLVMVVCIIWRQRTSRRRQRIVHGARRLHLRRDGVYKTSSSGTPWGVAQHCIAFAGSAHHLGPGF